jgi:multiple sugar transport system permease protein
MKKKPFLTKLQKHNLFMGLLFVSPWILGIAVLTLYPVLASFYYSLCEYNVLTKPVFIGLGNYVDLLTDEVFWQTLYNTLYTASLFLPISTVLAIGLALLLNTGIRGMTVYRIIFFVPSLVPMVAMCILWIWIFNPEYGILNYLLHLVGVKGPNWLGNPTWSKPAIILMGFWGVGNAVVIYLASLQEVPRSLYESADIDGCRWYHKVWHVTLPMISPIIFFNFIMGIIGTLQIFGTAYILTGGGPMRSSLFYAMYIYDNAFRYLKMGYACAMAVILFFLILGLTYLFMRATKKHVHYLGQ